MRILAALSFSEIPIGSRSGWHNIWHTSKKSGSLKVHIRNDKVLRATYTERQLFWTIKRSKELFILAESCAINNTVCGSLTQRQAEGVVQKTIINIEEYREVSGLNKWNNWTESNWNGSWILKERWSMFSNAVTLSQIYNFGEFCTNRLTGWRVHGSLN